MHVFAERVVGSDASHEHRFRLRWMVQSPVSDLKVGYMIWPDLLVQLENVCSDAFGMNSSNQFKLTTSGQLMHRRGTSIIGDTVGELTRH